MRQHRTVRDLVRNAPPDNPTFVVRPDRIRAAAKWFTDVCPAEPFYAVKANPAPHILSALWDAGIKNFDVASEAEVELVGRLLPQARLAFMHPVKPRRAIARAYHEFGCRIFVLDTLEELHKIVEETDHADDLTLVLRMAVSNDGATVPLAGKFGVSSDDAADLLRAARGYADELGVAFHVGSQAMNPLAWRTAMADVSRVIVQASVTVDIVDIGGGFPAVYADSVPPSMEYYADMVSAAFEEMMVLENADLWCEPGRALVAEAESLVLKVEMVKDDVIYMNDGAFGALYDAATLDWKFATRVLTTSGEKRDAGLTPFTAYGPTCDSADKLQSPLMLPADLKSGDYIEFGNLGAYGRCMATRFNGFGSYDTEEVRDAPWPTLYGTEEAQVISLDARRLMASGTSKP